MTVSEPARILSAVVSSSVSFVCAAVLSRQPVATICRTPSPSRYCAVQVAASVTIRIPSAVSDAVRCLPRLSVHFANCLPLRVKITASVGNGRVTVWRFSEAIASTPYATQKENTAAGELSQFFGSYPIRVVFVLDVIRNQLSQLFDSDSLILDTFRRQPGITLKRVVLFLQRFDF